MTRSSEAPRLRFGDQDPFRVVTLRRSDWALLRRVRLLALIDSPKAFAGNYLVEREFPAAIWQARLATSTWVVARRGLAQDVVGIACVVEPEEDVPHVESAWVDPSARGQGVLRQMMEILEGGLRARGIAALWLWVFDHNHGAWQAYQNLGFRPTGEAQPFYLDRGRQVGERRMAKMLVPANPLAGNIAMEVCSG